MEDHYKTFIVRSNLIVLVPVLNSKTQTEQDFAEIAGAGLNYVRIPIPFWAIDVWSGEPFLKGTSWTFVFAD